MINELTTCGFKWGSAEVIRAFYDRRYYTIIIRTPYQDLQVHVSPTGRSIKTVLVPKVQK